MKLQFTLLLCLIAMLSSGQEGWLNQIPLETYPALRGIYAVDSENLWVVGDDGIILHSSDGGESWETQVSGTDVILMTVEFINADTGWVSGYDDNSHSVVLRTFNGGASWEPQELEGPGDYVPIWDIDFVEGPPGEPKRGFLTGGLSHTWRTDDYGDFWKNMRGDCGEGNFHSCCMVDSLLGWYVGMPSATNYYTIMQTADGGFTWTEQTNPTDQPLRSVCFMNHQRGLTVGLQGTILSTDDGGLNWTSRDNSGSRWESVYLTESGRAWVAGDGGDVAFSSDWGITWEVQQSNVMAELWEVFFIDDNEGWIVGGGFGHEGVILHTTNGGAVMGLEDHEMSLLYKNQPNPFKSSTTLSYTVRRSADIKLSVFDLMGSEIEVLVNTYQKVGEYAVVFNAGTHNSGFYLCRLEVEGKHMSTIKMALVK